MTASPGTPAPISGYPEFLMRTSLLSCDAWGAKAISQLCQIPSMQMILDPLCPFDAPQLISQPWKARSAVVVPLKNWHRLGISSCSATTHPWEQHADLTPGAFLILSTTSSQHLRCAMRIVPA